MRSKAEASQIQMYR